jgi:hypothetical protein
VGRVSTALEAKASLPRTPGEKRRQGRVCSGLKEGLPHSPATCHHHRFDPTWRTSRSERLAPEGLDSPSALGVTEWSLGVDLQRR